MSTISSLTVKIGADISELEKAMGRASKAMEETGKRMTALGKTLSTRVTAPIVAMGALSVKAFGIQEKAELQLRAALQANGREVDKLFGRYNTFAQEMQRVTVVGDETALAMLAQAESFGLSADSAERAVRNSIAMQSAFGVNAKSALRYTAALESGNATMLARYIPSLRDITDESEKVAEAQRILGNAFSSAEAEAQGSAGQITQLKNATGDLMEVIGSVVAEAIMPFIKRMKEVVQTLQNVDREILKNIVTWMGIAAAIPLVIMAVGKLITVIGLLMSPLALKLAAIVAVGVAINTLIHNIEPLAERFKFYFSKAKDAVLDMVSASLKALAKLVSYVDKVAGMALTGLAFSLEEAKDGLDTPEFTEFTGIMEALGDSFAWVTDKINGFIFAGTGASKVAEKWGKVMDSVSLPMETTEDRIKRISKKLLKMRPQIDKTISKWDQFKTAFEVIGGEFKSFLAGEMSSAVLKFGDSLGRSLSGAENQWQTTFEKIAMVVLDFASSLATLAAGIGSVMLFIPGFQGAGAGLLAAALALQAISSGFSAGIQKRASNRESGATSVNDALITSGGKVIKFHPDDNILAMKDFSKLGAMGGGQRVEVFGKISGQDIFISSDRGGSSFNR
jgi:hypothetical protein